MAVARDRYEDPFVPAEFGATYGEYVCSYRYQGGLVEVHLFKTPEHKWLAFLTKAPGYPMPEAQALVDDAQRTEAERRAEAPSSARAALVLDPYSIPRSGTG